MQEEQSQPSLRLCDVVRPSAGSCGFHLTRTAWDPYPWVSAVESGSAAETAGLQAGDCVLEVNGEDVLGQRIGDVASKVRARGDRVTLLLWNAGSDPHTAASSISGSGTTPVSLQRLSSCLQSVIQLLECPVCLETIPPPTFQCCNGHVLCGRCRARADRCPVCRVSLGPRGRCLLADKLHNLLTTTLNHYKQKCPENKKQPYNHSALYLKSRIIADRVQGTAGDQPKPTAGTSNENSSTQEYSELSSEMTQLKESVSSDGKIRDASQNTTGDMDAKFLTSHVLVKHKISSGENNRSHNDQLSVRQVPGATPSPLITRSLSAEQIPIGNELVPAKTSCSEDDGLFLHCPFPMKSEPHCCSILNGSRTLLQHLRDVHQGPLVQYFLQPSSSGVTLRLPSSGSKALTSFTAYGDVVFFVEVAAGARPGHTLVWLWLLGDAIQADRYRLRLTLPEGDAHTGPVFPLTASWSDVVNSNCCLSIEERRYISGNLEVQLEILDVLKTN